MLPNGFGGAAGIAPGETMGPAPEFDPAILGAELVPNDDGSADLVIAADEPEAVRVLPHDTNLAEVLDVQTLNEIAFDVIEGFEADVESNRPSYEIFARGLKLLALMPGERADARFEGASAAVHPVLKEAVIRFGAEASGELIPAAGPARCQVIGDMTPAKQDAANRKQDWLNYWLTEGDAGYVDDFDKMLVQVAFYGHMFRKVFRDPMRGGSPSSRFLSPYDLVTAATTTELNGRDRTTQVEPLTRAEVRTLEIKGWYLDVDLAEPVDGATDWFPQQRDVDFRTPSDRPEDVEHVLLHQHVMLDLNGFEHVDEDGNPTGLPLPYVVTVDRETQRVLRLVRDWDQGDTEFNRRTTFVDYAYMRGLGFLGWGMIHLVGADTDDLSTLRQQAIDAFSFASFPGGLRTRGTKSEQTDLNIGPGEFPEIDTNGLPISAAVMALPYRDVPPSYPPIVEEILSGAQRIASVGDAAVGDGREDALPGTVIALIAQATKLQSSVIKRLHRAQRVELRLLADLFGRDADATYPYVVNGRAGQATASDFADNADVFPVADPNVPTQQHRLQLAQGVWTISKGSPPGMFDMRQVTEDLLRAMGRSEADIARLMPPPNQGQPADPVTEFAMLLKNMPLVAGPLQDHAAHLQAHMAQMTAPGIAQTPTSAQLMAHMADHLAHYYAAIVSKATGVPVQPGMPMPPPIEQQLSRAIAAASDQLRTELAQLMPTGANPQSMMELKVKSEEIAMKNADSERKAEASARAQEAEFLRQRVTVQNDRETRAADIFTSLVDLETARLKTVGDITKAGTETIGQQSEAAASVAVAHQDALAGRHRAVADIHQATTGLAGQHVQANADQVTALSNLAAAEVQREAEEARAEQAAGQAEG